MRRRRTEAQVWGRFPGKGAREMRELGLLKGKEGRNLAAQASKSGESAKIAECLWSGERFMGVWLRDLCSRHCKGLQRTAQEGLELATNCNGTKEKMVRYR